jgi:SAM-dependent methyltransferase
MPLTKCLNTRYKRDGTADKNLASTTGVRILHTFKRFNSYLTDFLKLLVIQEANWLTLYDDIKDLVRGGFDAVICLGNSFAHMTDSYGDQREQKQAIRNFEKCVKPGGLLLIDHRNYDNIMETGSTPSKCIYYNVSDNELDLEDNCSLTQRIIINFSECT